MGTFYSIDLGATSLRVLRVELGGAQTKILNLQVESQPISPNLMMGTAGVIGLYVLIEIFSLDTKHLCEKYFQLL